MNKFLISTPGRTASTSLFNYIEHSLNQHGQSVAAVDRGLYSDSEWESFNQCKLAAFTTFNPFNFTTILTKIDPAEWCLITLSRNDAAAWILSMNASLVTDNYHPGKEHREKSLTFRKDAFMSSYWYYQCWHNMIYTRSDNFGFGRVVAIDFDELVQDWAKAGRLINNWSWTEQPDLMRLGMTASWDDVVNLEEVLTWIPDERIISQIINSL
jgi:hypothetical protein